MPTRRLFPAKLLCTGLLSSSLVLGFAQGQAWADDAPPKPKPKTPKPKTPKPKTPKQKTSGNESKSKATKAKTKKTKVLGRRVLDLQGGIHQLGGRDGQKPTVFVFLGTECPISNRALPSLNKVSKLGLKLYGIVSEPFVTRAQAIKHSQDFKVGFPVIFDSSGLFARQLKPSHVPEAFIVGPQGLLYRGAIDDAFVAPSKPRQRVTHEYLNDAVAAVLQGQAPKAAQVPAVGCVFEGVKAKGKASLTFNHDIAPIIYKNCSHCHRPGEAAPFSLMNYQDVAKHAQQIAAVTSTRTMPPWKPAKGHGQFMEELRLSKAEIKAIAAWADAGAPEGKAENKVATPKFASGWKLGKPDMVLEMDKAYTVRAEGADDFRCFVIQTGLTENKHVVAMEYRPGAPTVVHHSILFLDDLGRGRKLAARDPKPGYGVFGGVGFAPNGSLGGYSPGAQPMFLPDGVGRLLKKGTDIILQVHYHPSGKVEKDRGKIGLYFAKKPIKKRLLGFVMGTRNIDIKAGVENYQRSAEMTLPAPVQFVGVTPHMHYLGKNMKVVATLPNGKKQSLIWIKDWDFRWQGQYLYRKPFDLPAGTVLTLTASYNNSESNTDNPSSPPKRVTYGDESTNEMCFCFFQITTRNMSDFQAVRMAMIQMFIKGGNPPRRRQKPKRKKAPPKDTPKARVEKKRAPKKKFF